MLQNFNLPNGTGKQTNYVNQSPDRTSNRANAHILFEEVYVLCAMRDNYIKVLTFLYSLNTHVDQLCI